jgi:hypothetical protein
VITASTTDASESHQHIRLKALLKLLATIELFRGLQMLLLQGRENAGGGVTGMPRQFLRKGMAG